MFDIDTVRVYTRTKDLQDCEGSSGLRNRGGGVEVGALGIHKRGVRKVPAKTLPPC